MSRNLFFGPEVNTSGQNDSSPESFNSLDESGLASPYPKSPHFADVVSQPYNLPYSEEDQNNTNPECISHQENSVQDNFLQIKWIGGLPECWPPCLHNPYCWKSNDEEIAQAKEFAIEVIRNFPQLQHQDVGAYIIISKCCCTYYGVRRISSSSSSSEYNSVSNDPPTIQEFESWANELSYTCRACNEDFVPKIHQSDLCGTCSMFDFSECKHPYISHMSDMPTLEETEETLVKLLPCVSDCKKNQNNCDFDDGGLCNACPSCVVNRLYMHIDDET